MARRGGGVWGPQGHCCIADVPAQPASPSACLLTLEPPAQRARENMANAYALPCPLHVRAGPAGSTGRGPLETGRVTGAGAGRRNPSPPSQTEVGSHLCGTARQTQTRPCSQIKPPLPCPGAPRPPASLSETEITAPSCSGEVSCSGPSWAAAAQTVGGCDHGPQPRPPGPPRASAATAHHTCSKLQRWDPKLTARQLMTSLKDMFSEIIVSNVRKDQVLGCEHRPGHLEPSVVLVRTPHSRAHPPARAHTPTHAHTPMHARAHAHTPRAHAHTHPAGPAEPGQ